MKNATDITESFGTLYHPKSALVFYETDGVKNEVYVEHFDMDKNGSPINAHPLTENEAQMLARALVLEKDKASAFLQSHRILPTNILNINPNTEKSSVLWYTKSKERQLYFGDSLEIPNGKAQVPAMLWLASKSNLSVYALANDRRPTEKTPLYYAPFFNIYEKGNVCMGTVTIDIKKSASIEEFTSSWEHYFFNSYFSHLLCENLTTKNMVHLWKDLINTDKSFPKDVLKCNNKTLKNLLR